MLLSLDHTLTKRLRSFGEERLSFWKWIAAHGMWGFVLLWIFVTAMDWMAWWKPLIPLVLSYLSLLVAQAIIKRERPNFEKLSGYTMWVRTYSFPSGHATESAAFATILMLYPTFSDTFSLLTICGLSSVLCFLIIYSRIAVGVHYLSDVLVGCCLGILYAVAFVNI